MLVMALSNDLKQQDRFPYYRCTKLAMALGLADELRDLFSQVPYQDIQEVINENRERTGGLSRQ